MGRILNTLWIALPQHARKFDLALFRGIFVLVTFLLLLITATNLPAAIGNGKILYKEFVFLSVILLGLLAGRVTNDSLSDAQTEFLSLIYLTGLSSSYWCLLRVLESWVAFLSVWVIRLPILFWIVTQGGLRWSDLVANELLFLGLFFALSSRSFMLAHQTSEKKSVDSSGIGTLFAIEFCLLLPGIVIAMLSLLHVVVPAAIDRFANRVAEISLYSRFNFGFSSTVLSVPISANLLVYTVLGLWWLWRFRMLLYQCVGDSPVAHEQAAETKTRKKRRSSRPVRCWDDALAWHSYVHYAGGADNTVGRITIYVMAGILAAIALMTGWFVNALGLIVLGIFVGVVSSMNQPAHCFDKEIKGKTLSTLMLTPNEPLDFYHGWRRGALLMARPDFVAVLVATVVSFYFHPYFALTIASSAAAILVSGPFLMLSPLVPWNLKGVLTGLAVIIAIAIIVALGGMATAFTRKPVVFPLITGPLLWLFNHILKHTLVTHWMNWRIDVEA